MPAWTRTEPTEPGFYWWTFDHEAKEPQMVNVRKVLMTPGKAVSLYALQVVLQDGVVLPLSVVDGWWWGPLRPPKEKA